MSPKDAAKIIGCTPQLVRLLIRTGRMRARCLNGKYQVSVREVERIKNKPNADPRGRKRLGA